MFSIDQKPDLRVQMKVGLCTIKILVILLLCSVDYFLNGTKIFFVYKERTHLILPLMPDYAIMRRFYNHMQRFGSTSDVS